MSCPLLYRHVNVLVDDMVRWDRRYDQMNRCCASISRNILIAQVHADHRAKLHNFNSNSNSPDSVCVLDITTALGTDDPVAADLPTITLEASQHRIAAALQPTHWPVPADYNTE